MLLRSMNLSLNFTVYFHSFYFILFFLISFHFIDFYYLLKIKEKMESVLPRGYSWTGNVQTDIHTHTHYYY